MLSLLAAFVVEQCEEYTEERGMISQAATAVTALIASIARPEKRYRRKTARTAMTQTTTGDMESR